MAFGGISGGKWWDEELVCLPNSWHAQQLIIRLKIAAPSSLIGEHT